MWKWNFDDRIIPSIRNAEYQSEHIRLRDVGKRVEVGGNKEASGNETETHHKNRWTNTVRRNRETEEGEELWRENCPLSGRELYKRRLSEGRVFDYPVDSPPQPTQWLSASRYYYYYFISYFLRWRNAFVSVARSLRSRSPHLRLRHFGRCLWIMQGRPRLILFEIIFPHDISILM